MSLIFLNSHRVKSGSLNGRKLPPDYVLLGKFFDCGIIDRTATLDTGFESTVLDPLPSPSADFSLSFAEVCDRVAATIIDRATQEDRKVRVLWSGGIDSTVALIAIVKGASAAFLSERLEVLLSVESINEYPLFFRQFILGRLNYELISPPITDYFEGEDLIVTGEHGDQLFGSDKLLPFIANGLAGEDFATVVPIYLTAKFGHHKNTDRILRYLEPSLAASPVPIVNMADFFWWLNLTIKWQQVTLRLPVFTFQAEVSALVDRFHHFFRSSEFQEWSIGYHPQRVAPTLTSYKLPAKNYIFAFTQDEEYLRHKAKEPSLKNVIINRKKQGDDRYRVHMAEDYRPVVETFHKKFKNQNISE